MSIRERMSESLAISAGILLLALSARSVHAEPATRSFDFLEATIPEIQEALETGRVTSVDLVHQYLARIEAYDHAGPRLNAMITLNPNALEQARVLDEERRNRGSRGLLHGIPIVVKDNFETADLPTTGGSLALLDLRTTDDAFQVHKLREAGAIILGKTNLHELASGITTISSAGGQTRNPYDPERNPGGSSGGTGAAVAARFAVAGLGSDTCGSIRIPSSHNNLVGLRETMGLSSRDGIIPLSHTHDVGGPLARNVTDLAILLDATVGPDSNDPVTARSEGRIPDSYMDFLDPGGLEGVRIGLLKEYFGDEREDREIADVVMAAAEEMKKAGAALVEVGGIGLEELLEGTYLTNYEFKFDFIDYLAGLPEPPVRSLEEILQRGLYHEALKPSFEGRNVVETRDSEEYREALEKLGTVRTEILAVMREKNVDVLLYPTIRRKPARIGEPQGGSNCRLSAATGFPALSVPAGFTPDGLPVGVELFGEPFSEPELIQMAYAFEQATDHRHPPATTPRLVEGRVPRYAFESAASGEERVPPVETTAGARARMTLDPSTGEWTYTITTSGLGDDTILRACIHRGARGENGPVVYILAHASGEGCEGTLHVQPSDQKDLMEGRLYLSLYTRRYPQGAIRGQIVLKSGKT